MKAVISSFHPCSYFFLKDWHPNTVLSFDSHIDANLGGFRILETIERNKILECVLTRAATHFMMAKEFSNVIVAIPEIALKFDASITDEMIRESLVGFRKEGIEKTIVRKKEILKKLCGLKIIESPPKKPLEFSELLTEDCVIDIDIDYFTDMQSECYTRAVEQKNAELGKVEDVLKLIEKIKPEVITISEMKVSVLEDPNSKTRFFLKKLEDIEYKIEKNFVLNIEEEEYAMRTYNKLILKKGK